MFCTKERLEELRRMYPEGCRVMLDRMDDIQAPPAGAIGTVLKVDDAGHILVSWDTGGSLNVIDGEDLCHKIDPDPNHQEVAKKLHAFCQEVHYRQCPAIIGHWVPGMLDETERLFTSPGGMIRIIKSVVRFYDFARQHGETENTDKAKVILMLLADHYKAVRPKIGMAMALIDDFCRREYKMDSGGEYDDLSMVSIAYTTAWDSVTVQVFVDLLDYRLITYVDGEEAEVLCYVSLEEMIDTELRFLDFDSLVDIGRWEEAVCS